MSKVLNELGTQCAVFGNHEFGKKLKFNAIIHYYCVNVFFFFFRLWFGSIIRTCF